MALSTYALITLDEARRVCGLQGSAHDDHLEQAVNEASQMIEAEWGGPIVARGTIAVPLVEYHERGNREFRGVMSDLMVNDWPLSSVSAIYEGGTGSTGTGTLLTSSTDYRVINLSQDPPFRVIRRLSGGFPVAWPQNTGTSSYRAIEVRYLASYRRSDNVTDTTLPFIPPGVLSVARNLTKWLYVYKNGSRVGLESMTDPMGNRSFSGPPRVLKEWREQLIACGAMVHGVFRTGERD